MIIKLFHAVAWVGKAISLTNCYAQIELCPQTEFSKMWFCSDGKSRSLTVCSQSMAWLCNHHDNNTTQSHRFMCNILKACMPRRYYMRGHLGLPLCHIPIFDFHPSRGTEIVLQGQQWPIHLSRDHLSA